MTNSIKTILTYIILVLICLGLVAAFITATTVIQLGVAILLYPPLIFFCYKIFPRKKPYNSPLSQIVSPQPATSPEIIATPSRENQVVSDLNRRAFLKIIGATGISFFIVSILSRRVDGFFFGQNLVSKPTPAGNPSVTPANNAPVSATEGYKISEVDDGDIGYYGFINKDGGWFIMKSDSATGSFRYAKGATNFPDNWKNRKNLKYDYYYIVFP